MTGGIAAGFNKGKALQMTFKTTSAAMANSPAVKAARTIENKPFIIFKEVARLPWTSNGMYRVRFFPGTALYGEWSDKSASEQVALMSNRASFERVDRATWERAHNGGMNGWAAESSVDAQVQRDPRAPAGKAVQS